MEEKKGAFVKLPVQKFFGYGYFVEDQESPAVNYFERYDFNFCCLSELMDQSGEEESVEFS